MQDLITYKMKALQIPLFEVTIINIQVQTKFLIKMESLDMCYCAPFFLSSTLFRNCRSCLIFSCCCFKWLFCIHCMDVMFYLMNLLLIVCPKILKL